MSPYRIVSLRPLGQLLVCGPRAAWSFHCGRGDLGLGPYRIGLRRVGVPLRPVSCWARWSGTLELTGTRPGQLPSGTEQLLAAGALDKALSNQLASAQPAQAPVQIGVSFRSKGGNYCRTFQVREHTNLAGLACRDQDNWKLEALAQSDASPASHSDFRPAASALPAPIAQAVDQVIDGEPLDAKAETQARTNQWHGPQ